MSWVYVPALADSNSASGSPSPERAASLTSRGKPMRPQTFRRAWKKGGYIRRLSGLTWAPSTLDRGVASYIASHQATPASPTVWPDADGMTPTTDGLSTKCCASSMSVGRVVSSERTCRGMPTASSRHSCRHWKDWATALRREYSARRKSAQAIAESACSSWRTPSDNSRRGGAQDPAKRTAGGHTVNLQDQASTWPTVRACSGKRSSGANRTELTEAWGTPTAQDSEQSGGKGCVAAGNRGPSLHNQADSWPTPAARDHKSDHAKKTDTELYGAKGAPLSRVATCRFSLQAPAMPAGPESSTTRRTLNPLFVEWLMGLPLNWTLADPRSPFESPRPPSTSIAPCGGESTGSAPAETPLSLWLQRMRGELSKLLCELSDSRERSRLL